MALQFHDAGRLAADAASHQARDDGLQWQVTVQFAVATGQAHASTEQPAPA
jgi:hypothetical protein